MMVVWETSIGSITTFSGSSTIICAGSAAYMGKMIDVTVAAREDGMLTIAEDVALWQHATE